MNPGSLRRSFNRRAFLLASASTAVVRGAGRLPRNVMLYGRDEAVPALMHLSAGPVTCVFEPDIAFLRYIKFGDREILRGLYAAVRDKVWGTVAPKVSNIALETRSGSFRLTFTVENREGDIDFGWQGVITGATDGTVRYEFNGRARSTFLRNRLGFAVLHPVKECAGRPAVVEKAGGGTMKGTFPDAISPHQPFLDMRAITHEIVPGVEGEVRFEGEVFEMEDHRNWTDGNYKTYCTPLAKPFPVQVKAGTEVRQAVSIRPKGKGAVPAPASGPVQIEVGQTAVKLPRLGVGLAAGAPAQTPVELARIKAARLAHLRVDLRLWDPGWRALWDRAVAESAATTDGIEAAVFLGPDSEAALAQLGALRGRVARWLVFQRDADTTPPQALSHARKHLKNAPVGGGVNTYFTELNRERPPAGIDLACYSINPQVHAFDNQSLVENLEAQADTVKSAHLFLASKPLAVTPVTLKPRFNPQAKGAPEPVVAGRLPSAIDPRQVSLFGAAWTLGSIKYLAEQRVQSITYYETHGWAGLMESAAGSRMPDLFRSLPGQTFPLYHVLADAAAFGAGEAIVSTSSRPLEACSLALRQGTRRRLFVANLTNDTCAVTIDGDWLGRRARVSQLDEFTYETAAMEPERYRAIPGALQEALRGAYRLALAPYAVVRLDA